MTDYITKGDRVEITLAGKKKKGTVTDVVLSLWGGRPAYRPDRKGRNRRGY